MDLPFTVKRHVDKEALTDAKARVRSVLSVGRLCPECRATAELAVRPHHSPREIEGFKLIFSATCEACEWQYNLMGPRMTTTVEPAQ